MTNYDQLLTSVEILSNTRDIRQMYDITSTLQYSKTCWIYKSTAYHFDIFYQLLILFLFTKILT